MGMTNPRDVITVFLIAVDMLTRFTRINHIRTMRMQFSRLDGEVMKRIVNIPFHSGALLLLCVALSSSCTSSNSKSPGIEAEKGEIVSPGPQAIPKGAWYNGTLRDSIPDGEGEMRFADGSSYFGSWVDGYRHGHGTYTDSQMIYVGEWKYDVPNGHGKANYSTGWSYEGEWANGNHHGFGRQVGTDGSISEGEFFNGAMNGKGRTTWPSGEVHEGYYKDGLIDGHGRRTYGNGQVYEGVWVDGGPSGRGKHTWPDGRVFVGMFVDGKANGEGVLTFPDGRVLKGFWRNDEYVGDKSD